MVLPLDTAGALVNAEPELRTAQRLYRARRIGTTFGRTYLGIRTHRFIANHLAPPDMRERWSRLHRDSAREIYATAVELRGLILGQFDPVAIEAAGRASVQRRDLIRQAMALNGTSWDYFPYFDASKQYVR